MLPELFLNENEHLYRYDISQPLDKWSDDFHSLEYTYPDKYKNQFGGYFFFRSEKHAQKIARKSLIKNNISQKGYWVTHAKVQKTLRLLNLLEYQTITAVFLEFFENNFDIFTEEFLVNPGVKVSPKMMVFKDMLQQAYLSMKNKKSKDNLLISPDIELLKQQVESHYQSNLNIGYLGQVLTDFENGLLFKQLLLDNNFEGYVFNEAIYCGEHTYVDVIQYNIILYLDVLRVYFIR